MSFQARSSPIVESEKPCEPKTSDSLHSRPELLTCRLVAVGVDGNLAVSDLYTYLSGFGEIQFCVAIPSAIQVSQLGELHFRSCRGADDHQARGPGVYNALIEVSKLETVCQIIDSKSAFFEGWATAQTSSSVSDRLLKAAQKRTLYVCGLRKTLQEAELHTLMETLGPVEYVRIIRNLRNAWSKGFGFITFASTTSARKALQMGGITHLGKKMRWSAFDQSLLVHGRPDFTFESGPDAEEGPTMQYLHQDRNQNPYLDFGMSIKTPVNIRNSFEKKTTKYRERPKGARYSTDAHSLKCKAEILDHQYKFNRSRIISSAAVREYFRRMGQY